MISSIKGPKLKAHTFKLLPGQPAKDFRAFGTFVFLDIAASAIEVSVNNQDFVPLREGRGYQFDEEFDTLYLRAPGQTPTEGVIVTGYGGVIAITGGSGGGGMGNAAPITLMPYDSYAALGNAATSMSPTGVYAVVITGSTPLFETWQLRAWTDAAAPATNTAEGRIVPADYTAANKRIWYRT